MEELTYKDLSERELDTLKDIYISSKVNTMTESDLRKFVKEIIIDQIKGTVGNAEEKEAWQEIKEHFSDDLDKKILEVKERCNKSYKEEQKSHDQWWNQVRLQSRRWIRENRLPEMEATVEAPEIIRQKSQAQLKRLQGEDRKLNLGDVLLIDCEDSKLVFELSSAFAGHGRPILVVTRTNPNVLNREFDLPLNSCLWLSSKEEKGSILPDLDLLRKQK